MPLQLHGEPAGPRFIQQSFPFITSISRTCHNVSWSSALPRSLTLWHNEERSGGDDRRQVLCLMTHTLAPPTAALPGPGRAMHSDESKGRELHSLTPALLGRHPPPLNACPRPESQYHISPFSLPSSELQDCRTSQLCQCPSLPRKLRHSSSHPSGGVACSQSHPLPESQEEPSSWCEGSSSSGGSDNFQREWRGDGSTEIPSAEERSVGGKEALGREGWQERGSGAETGPEREQEMDMEAVWNQRWQRESQENKWGGWDQPIESDELGGWLYPMYESADCFDCEVEILGTKVLVTVAATALTVETWLQEHRGETVFGLDIEWRPIFQKGDYNDAALLQLSLGKRCLLIQLLFIDVLPASLKNMLADPSVTLGGVGIKADTKKLKKDYGLVCAGEVDLAILAASTLKTRALRRAGIATLVDKVLGLPYKKNRRATMSNWEIRHLTFQQIQYAAADAWLSYSILMALLALKKQPAIKQTIECVETSLVQVIKLSGSEDHGPSLSGA